MASYQDYEIIDFKARLLMAEIDMNAMVAENRQREALGQSMAYTDKDFMSLIDKYSIGYNDVPVYGGGC